MTAYYPVFDDEIEQGPPGMPGIGFKLTNDGNYDMEGKDPENAKHAVNKQYFENNALILSGGSYDARNKNISNVKEPENPNDVVIKKHLDYYCILWDTVNKSYFAHNQRISSVKWPKKETDCTNKYYVDMKTFCATTDRLVQFTGVGYQAFQFNEFTSKLLDSNLKLSQNMFMKITIFLACDKIDESPLIRLDKGKELLLNKAIRVNEESITMFAYGKLNEILLLSVLSGGKCKLKPYLHIEKIEFSFKT
ncbi:uncharacterized protein TNCV_902411 [Trichonephila clavipes]|nr:uncharacterized protein TNCV_2252571 [Trichonephila clavipes]GFX48859.1 uncharacterized protein TNCV_902411 [Trichonephila clavipes]